METLNIQIIDVDLRPALVGLTLPQKLDVLLFALEEDSWKEIFNKLNLTKDDDNLFPTVEIKECIKRAEKRNVLKELWNLTIVHHPHMVNYVQSF